MVLKGLRTSQIKFCKISFSLLVISLEGLVLFEGFPKNRIQRFLKFLEFQELEVIKKNSNNCQTLVDKSLQGHPLGV
jgi:hypothetical protein